MLRTIRQTSIALLMLLVAHAVCAQEPAKPSPNLAPVITGSALGEHLRFTAPSSVVQMHLQVYTESGQVLFDVTSRGNVLDWTMQDGAGEQLASGSYLCVVTIKSLSGRLSQRIGSVSIQDKRVEFQVVDVKQFTSAQQQAVGPIEENGSLTILKRDEAEAATVLANDGKDGQLIRGRGALSFRLGDFFSGTDREQMRLTEEGNLGIGTTKPRAKLDVDGAIRAGEGFMFADGSTLNINEKGVLTRTSADGAAPNAVAATQNRLARFTDSAGTVGDSLVNDTGIGLQLTVPPSGSSDTNLLYLNSTNGTIGALAGSTPFYGANNGPFFAMRGNAYSIIAGQRGMFTMSAGNVTSPTGMDGSMKFNTGNDQTRMIVTPAGKVGVGTITPVAQLDVAGNINTSTQYNIGGARVFSVSGPDLFGTVPTNTFAGADSGKSNIANADDGEGISNSFFGSFAGELNAFGTANSFFGTAAGRSNFTGDGNSFFGGAAGYGTTGGHANSFFGSGTGGSNTNQTNNTLVGSYSDVAAGVNNATAVGSQAKVSQSNSLVLGSINTVNGAMASTRVGIGTTAPEQTLQVNGDSEILSTGNGAGFKFRNRGSTSFADDWVWYSSGNTARLFRATVGDLLFVSPNGNFGIGELSALAKFKVAGGDAAITTQGKGLILRATDGGNCYRITVNNAGLLGSTFVPCP